MHTLFIVCALAGGAVLAIQLVLMVLGHDTGGDVDTEFHLDEAGAGGSPFFAHLSLKAIVAFITFFGLAGWVAEEMQARPMVQIACAAGGGLAAFYTIALIMSSFHRLESKGNIKPQNAVGQVGEVHFVVPARRGGAGQVTVNVQGRRVQFKALTDGDQLKTGAQVRIDAVEGGETLRVSAVI